MASPKELVSVVADITGLEEGTVILHDRNLLLAGLRSPGMRGRGVSRVNAQDAAHLLIAIIAAHSVKDSARAVQRHGQIRLDKRWSLSFLPIPELMALPAGHTFVEAVTALIEAGISGSLPAAAAHACGDEQDLAGDGRVGIEIKVTAKNPAPGPRIRVALLDPEKVETHQYNKSGTGSDIAATITATYEELHADLTAEQSFTHRSIMRVAELLRRDASD